MKFGEDDYIYWFMSKSWHVSVLRYKYTLKLRQGRSNVIVNALTISIVHKLLKKYDLPSLSYLSQFHSSVAVSADACLVPDMLSNIFH